MWEQTFDVLPDFVIIIDENHIIKKINRNFTERLDGKPEDFIGKPCYSLVHSSNEPPDFCPHSLLLKDNKEHTKKFFIDSLNGYYKVSVSPIFEEDELKGAVHIVHNITEVKKLEESHNRLITIVESSENTIIGKDLDGTITDWNRGAEKMYGYSAKEAVGRSISMLVPEHLEDDLWWIMNEIKSGRSIKNYETVRTTKDQTLIPVSLSISPIIDPNGTTIGASTIAIDITERKKIERHRRELLERQKNLTKQLQAANKELLDIQQKLTKTIKKLEISNSELQQFAYVASHDLKEPLRMVTSFLQLLKQRYEYELDSDANEFIDFAVDGAKRMHNLIEDLLAYSRIMTQGKEFSSVNMDELLDHVTINLKVSIDENHAEVTHDPLPKIRADESQMIQLIQNLFENSIKYRKQEVPKIHVSVKDTEDEWIFSVKDNGIGIANQHVKKIFMIFKRLHTNQEYDGTGIGLAIIKRIIDRHSGRVWVESELGKGSTFFFTISKNL